MDSPLDQVAVLGQIALAMFLAGLIGVDREQHDKPAGLRTHMLIAGASAFFVGLALSLVETAQPELPTGGVRVDPIRVIEAVVAGVSFLGAGTIIRRPRDSRVDGLTTASSMLFSAGIGIACATQQFLLAAGATTFTLLTLRLVRRVDGWIDRKRA